MRDRMMVCSAAASCAKKCDGKTEHPFSEACCRIACRDQGQAVGCVPVVPEVAEPEMMQCPGWPTCADDSCRGHLGVHERRATCSSDGCNRSREAGPCVPVAAKPKPDPRLARDAAWDAVRAAVGAVTVKCHDYQELREACPGDEA